MKRRLQTRLAAIEQQTAGDTISPAAEIMLAAVYARVHALFLPCRTSPQRWPAIDRLRREYLAGSVGVSAQGNGQKNWVKAHAARHELESRGLAVAVRGAVETTGLLLTYKGRAVALNLCLPLVPTIPLSETMVTRLESLEPSRIRGSERWVSESKLFALPCTGDTGGWQSLTDMLLEPAISGSVDSMADCVGHVFYRWLKPFGGLPEVDGIEASERAVDAYLTAWTSELSRLQNLTATDGEMCIPLSVTLEKRP